MRIYWKRSFTAAALFFTIATFYLTVIHETKRSDAQLLARAIVLQQLDSPRSLQVFQDLQNDSLPFSVPYHILAGSPTPNQKFLTVGLCSIKRKRGSYLLDTLKSIFSQSSEEELRDMVVVVFLADFDTGWNERTAREIADRFSVPILKGQLLVVHAPQSYYPPLEGLKRNFNDSAARVHFRSKQNVDYAFLFGFSANLSSYYIMLEDDVTCAKGFLTGIRKFIRSQGQAYWVTLEFSKLGYIGKLYHSKDLPQLARFLFLFYQEMPCDWLLNHFNMLLTQKDTIRSKPSLFQHVGLYSSFGGTLNRLKDDEFEEYPGILADNPPANIWTDISQFEKYTADKAYSNRAGYFWGKTPAVGNHFTVVLHNPAVFTRVVIVTGSKDRRKDILESAEVAVGQNLVKTRKGPTCSEFIKLGHLVKGQFDRKNIEKEIGTSLSCLRIKVTNKQQEWVVIQDINIWIKDKN
ncbi:hypothetical protein COCON_G00148810 [Conger conger]|uniref:Alpha-1,3-mannosyl-glycoprotein 4-beta-N-acetylglucosaminyltransferase C n=1 Tax=Conger conger TaxID=82655 RepID=A0A9Q1DC99_CONCO|nr:alpha-1,6-mannosyl-glycoprotein 4-beta-N-acetylglucosaminyltransferase-like [Conger conger]KAJ8265782.1 hypothetical protein COCON_G00148810 [Conger conger]